MKTYPDLSREERIAKIMDQRREDLALVLENLHEDLNISAVLRTAESFGAGLICVIHPKDKKPRLSKNTSSGATKWLNVKFYTSTTTCLNALKKKGFKIVAAIVDPQAKVLWEAKLSGKIAVMVGSEAPGLSEKAVQMADLKLYLPMYGLTESLNVSVAAALFLYETVRQKEA